MESEAGEATYGVLKLQSPAPSNTGKFIFVKNKVIVNK